MQDHLPSTTYLGRQEAMQYLRKEELAHGQHKGEVKAESGCNGTGVWMAWADWSLGVGLAAQACTVLYSPSQAQYANMRHFELAQQFH